MQISCFAGNFLTNISIRNYKDTDCKMRIKECKKYREKQQTKDELHHQEEDNHEKYKMKKSGYIEEYDFDYDPHDAARDEYGFERD